MYIRNDYEECLKLIDEVLGETNQRNEFAAYTKGLIVRSQGQILQSLEHFKWSQRLSPLNISSLKQVAKCLYLIGRSKAAIEVFAEALKLNGDDWEIWHAKGKCHVNQSELEEAISCYRGANLIQKHDTTFIELGEVYVRKEDYPSAIDTYLEALEYSPENPELLTTLGLLYLRLGDNFKAFQYLGNALTLDPTHAKALLATGSIIQDRSDHDAALLKYRIIAVQNPNSAQLWNNIGMCFFGKNKYVAAIACLKKAQYLDPFEWIIPYNLGIAHIATQQFASAFHYFSAAASLNPHYGATYMYLGMSLCNLGDFENGCQAYEKALSLDEDFLVYLNYALSLYKFKQLEKSRLHFQRFTELFDKLDDSAKSIDPDILNKKRTLEEAFR